MKKNNNALSIIDFGVNKIMNIMFLMAVSIKHY